MAAPSPGYTVGICPRLTPIANMAYQVPIICFLVGFLMRRLSERIWCYLQPTRLPNEQPQFESHRCILKHTWGFFPVVFCGVKSGCFIKETCRQFQSWLKQAIFHRKLDHPQKIYLNLKMHHEEMYLHANDYFADWVEGGPPDWMRLRNATCQSQTSYALKA